MLFPLGLGRICLIIRENQSLKTSNDKAVSFTCVEIKISKLSGNPQEKERKVLKNQIKGTLTWKFTTVDYKGPQRKTDNRSFSNSIHSAALNEAFFTKPDSCAVSRSLALKQDARPVWRAFPESCSWGPWAHGRAQRKCLSLPPLH